MEAHVHTSVEDDDAEHWTLIVDCVPVGDTSFPATAARFEKIAAACNEIEQLRDRAENMDDLTLQNMQLMEDLRAARDRLHANTFEGPHRWGPWSAPYSALRHDSPSRAYPPTSSSLFRCWQERHCPCGNREHRQVQRATR